MSYLTCDSALGPLQWGPMRDEPHRITAGFVLPAALSHGAKPPSCVRWQRFLWSFIRPQRVTHGGLPRFVASDGVTSVTFHKKLHAFTNTVTNISGPRQQ